MKNFLWIIKKIITAIIIIIITIVVCKVMLLRSNCDNYDVFSGTYPTFRLDKSSYHIGDTMTLILKIQGNSEVRFYENIEHTLNVWLGLRVPYQEKYTSLSYDGISVDTIIPRERGFIKTYKIDEETPLEMEFHGYLQDAQEGNSFVIIFPELNKRFIIEKQAYSKAIALEIHGFLMPINPDPFDSLEDYVGLTKINIIISSVLPNFEIMK